MPAFVQLVLAESTGFIFLQLCATLEISGPSLIILTLWELIIIYQVFDDCGSNKNKKIVI